MAHRGVIGLHRFNVAVARHGDAVFRAFQLFLQFQEIGVGLQFWVFLHHHHQFRQGAGQAALRIAEGFQLLLIGGSVARQLYRAHFGARFGDFGQHFFFMLGIALHRGHQIGHQIGAALVLVHNLRPSSIGRLVLALHGVVTTTR